MALIELTANPNKINQILLSSAGLGRPLESIKSHWRTQGYRQLFATFKENPDAYLRQDNAESAAKDFARLPTMKEDEPNVGGEFEEFVGDWGDRGRLDEVGLRTGDPTYSPTMEKEDEPNVGREPRGPDESLGGCGRPHNVVPVVEEPSNSSTT